MCYTMAWWREGTMHRSSTGRVSVDSAMSAWIMTQKLLVSVLRRTNERLAVISITPVLTLTARRFLPY